MKIGLLARAPRLNEAWRRNTKVLARNFDTDFRASPATDYVGRCAAILVVVRAESGSGLGYPVYT